MKPEPPMERFKWKESWGTDGRLSLTLFDNDPPARNLLFATKRPAVAKVWESDATTWCFCEGEYPFSFDHVTSCMSREEAQAAVMAIYLLKGKG